jgi:polypeptide N-acetylgalactosaminyltransferase
MCGGRVEIAPCSHVGHIGHKHSSIDMNQKTKFRTKNLARVAAVWMDEYAPHHFATHTNPFVSLLK